MCVVYMVGKDEEIHLYFSTHVYTYTYVFLHLCQLYMYVYIYAYICMYMYVRIYMHIFLHLCQFNNFPTSRNYGWKFSWEKLSTKKLTMTK